MKTQMVVATLHRKPREYADKPANGNYIERANMLVSRAYAERINELNEKEKGYTLEYTIHEDKTDEYYKALNKESKTKKSKIED